MIPDDWYDLVLIGAGVLVVCVLIAYNPFAERLRHPMLFGLLSAAFIMAWPFIFLPLDVIDAGVTGPAPFVKQAVFASR
jgi:hypothetical protein